MRGIRNRLVEAAANVTGPRFRALAASSVIATSAILGSALAGGGHSGLLAALLSEAQGQAASASAAAADAAAAGGVEIPPPPTISGGPSAPAPGPGPVAQVAPTAQPTTTPPATEPEPTPEPEVPETPPVGAGPIKHVFVISLSSPGYEETFGEETSLMPYLSGKLRPEGQLLSGYSLLTEAGLPNRIAAVSGQPPNSLTKAECTSFVEFSNAAPDDDGVLDGPGCVYPVQALTIADQVTSGGLTWRAYMEDMSNGFGPGNCVHPAFGETDEPVSGGYAAVQNPFVYFHSLLDLGACGINNVPFDTLAKDLKKADTTANYTYISPNRCNAGRIGECEAQEPAAKRQDPTEPPTPPTTLPAETADAIARAKAGASADAFLEKWVPRILKSPAYKKDGALIITFGEAQPPEGAEDPLKVGTVLLSPLAPAGLTLGAEYDPYSLLRSTEDLFGLSALANAGAKGTLSFAGQLAGGGD